MVLVYDNVNFCKVEKCSQLVYRLHLRYNRHMQDTL